MKKIKILILLIVIYISILGITNRNNIKEKGTMTTEETIIAKDVNIKIENKQEQNEMNLEDKSITEEQIKSYLQGKIENKKVLKKKSINYSDIDKKQDIDKQEQQYNKKESQNNESNFVEGIKIEQGTIKEIYEMEERNTSPQLLKDNNARIKFDN